MNSEPSNAIENGFTAQLMNSVTPTPRQCSRTWPSAPKSILSSIGMIISQISAATGRLTLATSAAAMPAKRCGATWPSAMPATMHSATQSERNRSNVLMCASRHVGARRGRAFELADLAQARAQRHLVQLFDRQRGEQFDAPHQRAVGVEECRRDLSVGALRLRRIGNAP